MPISHHHAGHVHKVSEHFSLTHQDCLPEDDRLLAALFSADPFCHFHDINLLDAD
jgi:hypothetical protein